MKRLLVNIRGILADSIPDVRDSDIYIAVDHNVIPPGVKFPCIGLKDGEEEHTFGASCVEREMTVDVIVYSGLSKSESNIIGDESIAQKGVLELADTLEDVLLGQIPDNYQNVDLIRKHPSKLFMDDRSKFIQQKILTFKYLNIY
jgi:hypothetical protein